MRYTEILKPSDMEGPTDEARALQFEQLGFSDDISDAYNALVESAPNLSSAEYWEHESMRAPRANYQQSVEKLQALLGAQAHVNAVDTRLWEVYVDVFKDKHGFKPRGLHVTREAAIEFLNTA